MKVISTYCYMHNIHTLSKFCEDVTMTINFKMSDCVQGYQDTFIWNEVGHTKNIGKTSYKYLGILNLLHRMLKWSNMFVWVLLTC